MNITKDQVLGYSIIDNRLKIFVKQSSLSQSQNTNQSQEPSNQEGNTPDINDRDGEIIYYSNIEENSLSDSDTAESQNKRAFYEGWKKGDNYYVRINPKNNEYLTLIERPDIYLDPLFEFKKDNSATKIKNIEPAVFDISTGKLSKKGKLELS